MAEIEGRLHSCKATWFGFTKNVLATHANMVPRERLVQLQNHRRLVGAETEIFYDQYTDGDGTLRCVFFSGTRETA